MNTDEMNNDMIEEMGDISNNQWEEVNLPSVIANLFHTVNNCLGVVDQYKTGKQKNTPIKALHKAFYSTFGSAKDYTFNNQNMRYVMLIVSLAMPVDHILAKDKAEIDDLGLNKLLKEDNKGFEWNKEVISENSNLGDNITYLDFLTKIAQCIQLGNVKYTIDLKYFKFDDIIIKDDCLVEICKSIATIAIERKFSFENYLQKENIELKEKNEEINKLNYQLEEKNNALKENNKKLESALEKEEKLYKELHEKEKEMLSFFTHTMRNALATAPESLRQAIRLLGSEDYESNQKHYKAINKIAALFSTLSLTDCLIDTFKQSISEPEEFQRAWQNDNEGDATPKWVIASALRQSLNRIIFMSDTSELRQLLNNADIPAIVAMRKSFIDNILPLNLDNQGITAFYQWLSGITSLEITIEDHNLYFGVNQVKFSLLFAISSELILNALKYWNGSGKIQIRWYIEQEHFIFKVTNTCETNASSSLAGTHKGIAFIKRLIELLGEQAQFSCSVEEQLFIAELKLHQSLLEHNA
ncbi:MAG: hypothetical protein Q8N96_04775 [Methylovulum sp.]|nr:hypothetical protein [Methylovulum sp.]